MINKAVFSYWNTKDINNTSGYNSFKDFLNSISLAVNVAKRHFDEVELVTNNFGKEILIDNINLPFTSFKTTLNKFDNLNPIWWGFTKIYAYKEQELPFVHIDNDVFMFAKPNEEKLKGELLFQSIETPFNEFYSYYPKLLKVVEKAPYFPQLVKDNPVEHAFNCGIMGANNLDIIQEWYKLSESYVLNKKNEKFFKDENNLLIHQNLLHEQYFIASLCKQKGMKLNKDIKFHLDYKNLIKESNKHETHFVHTWGTVKKNIYVVERIKKRLEKEFPEALFNVNKFCK